MKKNFKDNFFHCLFSAIFGLSLYFLLFLPVEFLLTEVLFVVPRINPWINITLLLFFLLMANLFDWGKIIKKRKKLIVLLIIIVVSFSFYGVYHRAKLSLEYLPKIYQIKPAWIIQGQLVEIKGVNFGPVWKKGKVVVDGMDFRIKDWGENRIIAEAPVPSKEGHFLLFIETKEGRVSNTLTLEIKDPDYLKRYLR